MKLAIIAPKWPDSSLWGQIVFRFPYLALTSLAALTDEAWDIEIIDENVRPLDFQILPDLVAISIMTPLAPRGYAIADKYRSKGVAVVLGGIHPTMMPDEAALHADAIVLGEAETTWSRVLDDFCHDALKPVYRPEGFCRLDLLPVPRRELLQRKAYFFTNTLQTTRGCPFDCEFCSVTSFYGRTYRTRPVTDVVNELHQTGGGFTFFVDDNIVGKPAYAKKLFQALTPLKLKWFSQASLNIAQDPELLDLAQKSGCKGLFIGFESLSQESLKAMGKAVNRVSEYRQAIRTIHDHGIGIQGSFIFGTDQDNTTIFSDVLRFIEKTGLEAALFSVLTPFPGTRIHATLARENRILHADWEKYDMNHVVFRPQKMTPQQLQEGFNWSYKQLYGYPSMIKRLFPFKRSGLFFGIQNYGFRRAWRQTLKNLRYGGS
jgi:radical SAM superfamily enzyme YgiQ (UPF0313 family)